MAYIQERLTQDGKKSYRVQIRLKGHPTETATFDRITDAKRWVQETEVAMRSGRYLKTVEAKKHTVADMIDRYLETVVPHKRTDHKLQKQQLEWWRGQIGARSIADVTPAIVVKCRDTLAATPLPNGGARSPATVNRYFAVMSHAFTVAMKEWQWTEDNPFLKVSKMKEPRGRVRFLSDAERDRLFAACRESNPAMLPIITLLLWTGARKSEIVELRWADVDLERERLLFEETKNGERRGLPLVGGGLDAIREWGRVRRLDTDLVFPSPTMPQKALEIGKLWQTLRKHAELVDFPLHALRHSTASYLAQAGVPIHIIALILGHKTLSMAMRYSHLLENDARAALEKLKDRITS